jgi:excisionase family DNA binding protein
MSSNTAPRRPRARTYLPPTEASIGSFAEFAQGLRRAPGAHDAGHAKLVSPSGEERIVPIEIFEILEQVANTLAEGNGVTVAPSRMKLTTQEAADFLGVSRPTLVKLLEDGVIAFEKPGRHRRVALSDVVAFQERQASDRRTALRDMTALAQSASMEPGPVPPLKRLADFED